MYQDIEKKHMQLSLLSRVVEAVLHNAGLDTEFDLIKIEMSSEIEHKIFSLISLHEKLMKKSSVNEIKQIHNFDKIFFGIVNFFYNTGDYQKALEKTDFLLSITEDKSSRSEEHTSELQSPLNIV